MEPIFRRKTLTVFDLETTGLDPEKGAEIIEVGAVKLRNGEIQDEFQELIHPRRSIPKEIQDLTGITSHDVANADSHDQVLPRFLEYLGDDVLVAHNMPFDLGFLEHYAPRSINNPTIDTLAICRALGLFSSNKLDQISEELGIQRDQTHRALDDARATAKLCTWIAPRVKTVDDYRRCGIPDQLVAEIPAIVFSQISGISRTSLSKLTKEYDSVDQLAEDIRSDSLMLSVSQPEIERLREFFRDWEQREDLYRYLRDHGQGGTIFNGLDVGYWTAVNWFWNGMGIALLTAAITGTRSPGMFTLLVGLAVPCFFSSLVVVHFRNRPRGLLKQWISGLVFFGVALIFLWYWGLLR